MEFSGIVNPIKNENVFQYSHPRFVKKMTFPPQKTKGKIVKNTNTALFHKAKAAVIRAVLFCPKQDNKAQLECTFPEENVKWCLQWQNSERLLGVSIGLLRCSGWLVGGC